VRASGIIAHELQKYQLFCPQRLFASCQGRSFHASIEVLMNGRRRAFKRRTFQRLRARLAQEGAGDHHNVYVVLLDPAAAGIRKVLLENPARDPKKPIVYVGLTGLTPEERFANHKLGIKSSPLVRRFGIRLLPELYRHLNPMPYEAAAQMEKDLTEDLRRAGYTVVGGH
jgi:hypothetical protein